MRRHRQPCSCTACRYDARVGRASLISAEPRCRVTGNPCGTDTWGEGYACACGPCTAWLAQHVAALAEVVVDPEVLERAQRRDLERESVTEAIAAVGRRCEVA